MFNWLKRRRRKKLLASPWPTDWSTHLDNNVRLAANLDDIQRTKLQRLIRVFDAEKNWEGCDGLVVTEEMRISVAGNACLMLLGVDDFYFDNVRSVLMYPAAFRRDVNDGMVRKEASRSGEAWQGGPIILSWQDAIRGGRNTRDGRNVVIHEFAHALDGLDGSMGGSLMFTDTATAEHWTKTVDREYRKLQTSKQLGIPTLLDTYGATNKAEFFAVAAEFFFELPNEFQSHHDELFDLMCKYFQVNPVHWDASAK